MSLLQTLLSKKSYRIVSLSFCAFSMLLCGSIFAQTATFTKSYNCSSQNLAGINIFVDAPGSSYDQTIGMPTSGPLTYTIPTNAPAGQYFFRIGAPYNLGSFPSIVSMTKGGANLTQNFTIAHYYKADFSIDGIQYENPNGLGSVLELYKCTGTTNIPLGNLSTNQSYIGSYRITVFNSNISGQVGTQVGQSSWLSTFPANLFPYMPANATGQYLIVRMETRNPCGQSGYTLNAWVRWNGQESRPANFKLTNLTNAQVFNSTSAPAGPLMKPVSGSILHAAGTENSGFSEMRVRIFESTTAGVPTGVGEVVNHTYVNNNGLLSYTIPTKTFSDIFFDAGVTNPFSGTNFPTAKTKQWRIELYFKKPNCGWTTVPLFSYFKIGGTNPNGMANPNGGGVTQVLDERSEDSGFADLSIRVYPNPVSDVLNIEVLGDAATGGRLEIFDAMGRLMATVSAPDNQAQAAFALYQHPVGHYPLGTYTYRFQTGQTVQTGRFVKQ